MFRKTSRNLGQLVSDCTRLEQKIPVTYPSEIVSETWFTISARRSAFTAPGAGSSPNTTPTHRVMSSLFAFIWRSCALLGKYLSISTSIWCRPVKNKRIPGSDRETSYNERRSLGRCFPKSLSNASIQINARSQGATAAFRSSRASGTRRPRPPTGPFAF